MNLQPIDKKEIWEEFLAKCEEKTFLQSWNWGEFNKMMGERVWRFGVYEKDELTALALVVETVAKRGTFLLVPHGPVTQYEIGNRKYEVLKILLEKLKKIAKEAKASFIRVSPIWERSPENEEIFNKLGFRRAPILVHPEASWKLDIRPSEEELLMGMRKTTRYLIRKAQKDRDLKIFQTQELKHLETFNRLYQQIVDMRRFIPFSLVYLKNEFTVFNNDNQISLFFGKYKNEIVASAFVIFWSNIGFYHHAALSPKYHKIPIAYLLQWEAIREAKKRGCVLYDFWGYVSPTEHPHHPWAGPTLFKMGFGGRKSEYVKTQDFVLSSKYWLTFLFEKLRRFKRGV